MQIFIGPLVHTLNPTTIQYSPSSILGVSDTGVIDFVAHNIRPDDIDHAVDSLLHENAKKGWPEDTSAISKTILEPGEFLCPGFVDTHTHG